MKLQKKTLNDQYQRSLVEQNDQFIKRYDGLAKDYETQLSGFLERYEKMVRELVSQQGQLDNTLEGLQEGLAAKDILADYIRALGENRK